MAETLSPEPPERASNGLGIEEGLAMLVFIGSIFFLISFWLHFPNLSPSNYSDIVGSFWTRIAKAPGIVPYLDYQLEYPAVSAIVLYVSSLSRNIYWFYATFSAILFASMLGSLYVVYRALKERGESTQRVLYFMIATPSFLYFSVYSFDWTGAVFMVAALYFGYRRQALRSGVSMGLAVAARVFPIVCLPFLFLEFKSKKNRALLLASTAVSWLAVNAYFMASDFSGWVYPYAFQAGFYAEDSWLNIFSPYYTQVSEMLLLVALGAVLYRRRSFTIYQQGLLAVLAFVVFDYKFPPQYFILLLPLFALAGENYIAFMVANFLNVLLILWYFSPDFSLGSAIAVSSPVQWVAYLRQFILMSIFVNMLVRGGGRGEVAPEAGVALEEKLPIPISLQASDDASENATD